MPKAKGEIADELNEMLRKGGRPYLTLTWRDFYNLCDRERFKQPFLDGIQSESSGRFQLIVAYGKNAVMICHDRNFAARREEAAS